MARSCVGAVVGGVVCVWSLNEARASPMGWRLSPAYDMNPTPVEIRPRVLTTAIDFDNTEADIEIAKSVAKDFRLSKKQADVIIKAVSNAVQNWQKVALNYGLSKQECNRMASAFKC